VPLEHSWFGPHAVDLWNHLGGDDDRRPEDLDRTLAGAAMTGHVAWWTYCWPTQQQGRRSPGGTIGLPYLDGDPGVSLSVTAPVVA
jgi:hypothetical protein